ncbi:MAG: protein phosphatase CheZ [Maricaulaceae bacterium]
MPAQAVAAQVKEALDKLRTADKNDPRLMEVLELSHQLVDTMKLFFGSLDNSIYGEFRYIAEYISKARDEISALGPNDLKADRLPSAGRELDAVVRDTERATETIMQEAEKLLDLDHDDDADAYKMKVDDAMLRVIEACSFQDITGQRVQKVVATVKHIEERITRFATVMGVKDDEPEENDYERRRRTLMLNGPAIDGPSVGQDTIDQFFADVKPVEIQADPEWKQVAPKAAPEPEDEAEDELSGLDQSDIDALFD